MLRALICAATLGVSAGFVALSTGCETTSSRPSGGHTRELAGGVIEHVPSGMKFPPVVEGFARGEIRKYDADGLNISAGYNLNSSSAAVALTVFVYPSPTLLASMAGNPSLRQAATRAEYARSKADIVQMRATRILAEMEVPAPPFAAGQTGFFGQFGYTEMFARQVRPLESLLYCSVSSTRPGRSSTASPTPSKTSRPVRPRSASCGP